MYILWVLPLPSAHVKHGTKNFFLICRITPLPSGGFLHIGICHIKFFLCYNSFMHIPYHYPFRLINIYLMFWIKCFIHFLMVDHMSCISFIPINFCYHACVPAWFFTIGIPVSWSAFLFFIYAIVNRGFINNGIYYSAFSCHYDTPCNDCLSLSAWLFLVLLMRLTNSTYLSEYRNIISILLSSYTRIWLISSITTFRVRLSILPFPNYSI